MGLTSMVGLASGVGRRGGGFMESHQPSSVKAGGHARGCQELSVSPSVGEP